MYALAMKMCKLAVLWIRNDFFRIRIRIRIRLFEEFRIRFRIRIRIRIRIRLRIRILYKFVVYICICTHTNKNTYIYTSTYIYTRTYTLLFICNYYINYIYPDKPCITFVSHTVIYILLNIYIYVCVYICVNVYIYVCIYIVTVRKQPLLLCVLCGAIVILYIRVPHWHCFSGQECVGYSYDQLTRPTHRNGRFLFWGVKIWFIWEHLQKKISNLNQFTVLIVHLVEKM